VGRPSVVNERREQIVWGLYECLARTDFSRVTVKDIANRAGVAPGLVHHYFASKDDIYVGLATSIRDRYETMFDDNLAQLPISETPRHATLEFIVDQLILDTPLNRVFYNLVQRSLENEALREPIRALLDHYRDRLETEIGAPGAAIVAHIEGLAIQHLIDPEKFTRNDFVAMVTTFLAKTEETT